MASHINMKMVVEFTTKPQSVDSWPATRKCQTRLLGALYVQDSRIGPFFQSMRLKDEEGSHRFPYPREDMRIRDESKS